MRRFSSQHANLSDAIFGNDTGEDIYRRGAEHLWHAHDRRTAEITSHLKCKTGTIATCALRRYISNKGSLFASYDWNEQKRLLLPHRDVAP